MEPAKLLEGLFDKKKMVLIKLFLDNPEREYGLREAAKITRVPPATTHRILHTLVKMEVVDERKVRQLRLYKLSGNKATKFLDELLAVKKSAVEEWVDLVKAIPSVESIVQYGVPTKDKAVFFLIGENIEPSAVDRIVGEIYDKYRFRIDKTILPQLSFDQMTNMGLLNAEKRVLFRRGQ